jgi:uncharacterized zinc-type alcohol dehydrogenase-like protein
MASVRAWAATKAGAPLSPWSYDPGPLPDGWVEVAVEHCGICHSDLSMLDNEWRRSTYPLVAGHEVVGRVVAAGDRVQRVAVGTRVGVGWYAASCLHCPPCVRGDQHLCQAGQETIIGRHGGFAERVRCHWLWATPLPDGVDATAAGPLFCGGVTVFGPIVEFGVRPTDRVAVVGIGGLGHLALRFLRGWGCEVAAITSNASKRDEILALGAHEVVAVAEPGALARQRGRFDFILVTANVAQPWTDLLAALAPRGRLHVVGAVLDPMPIPAFALIGGQKSLSGSPLGSPSVTARMLDFCARHRIAPQVERFPMSRINDAFEHLRAGKARWRIVLDNDFA